jgi:hypothetical protein
MFDSSGRFGGTTEEMNLNQGECNCLGCQLKRALSGKQTSGMIMIDVPVSSGAQSIRNEKGELVVFSSNEDGKTNLCFPLENYGEVKSLIKLRKSIDEAKRLLDEIPASVEIFKRIFDGEPEAYDNMPNAGKNRLSELNNRLISLLQEKAAEIQSKDFSSDAADEQKVSDLLYELDNVFLILTGEGYEKWIIERLASDESISENPNLVMIKDAIEAFKKDVSDTVAIQAVTSELNKILEEYEQQESGILSMLPPELHNATEPSYIKISSEDLILAVKTFVDSKAETAEA